MPSASRDIPSLSPTDDTCGLTADFIALDSHELSLGDEISGRLPHGYASREPMLDDDCLVARHVVPFDNYAWPVWHRIASDILGEPCDLRDASQIDRLIQLRGLFPRANASEPQWIALYQTDLSILLETGQDQDAVTNLRMDVLFATTHPSDPYYYIDARAISREHWERVSPLIFDRVYSDLDGSSVDLIFDRPDLTTGHPSARAFAALRELQNALSEYELAPGKQPAFESYTERLAHEVAESPACITFLTDHSTDAFATLATFVAERHPGWLDSLPILPALGDLRPVPLAWNGTIKVLGLHQHLTERSHPSGPDEEPTSYDIYAERHDASLVRLGATHTLAEATRLKDELEAIWTPFRQSASTV